MKKSDITVLPEYYDSYINEIEDIDLTEALEKYGPELLKKDKEKLISLGDKVYAPGKWTVKDIIQHMIDAERVFAYRALRIARNDKTSLPGFDENEYVPMADANKRSIDELLNEFEAVRKSNVVMFKSFNDEMLIRNGTCSDNNISVLAIGFVLAGHMYHHTKVIQEKYFPL